PVAGVFPSCWRVSRTTSPAPTGPPSWRLSCTRRGEVGATPDSSSNVTNRSTSRCVGTDAVTQTMPSAPDATTATFGTGAASYMLRLDVVSFESHGATRTQPGWVAPSAVTVSATGTPGGPAGTTSGVNAGCGD